MLHSTERDSQRVTQARADYHFETTGLDLKRYKFIDESGFNIAMTPTYGRAPKDEQVAGSVPQNYGENLAVIGALTSSGLQAMMTIDGATDVQVFRGYVEQVLCPTLRAGMW